MPHVIRLVGPWGSDRGAFSASGVPPAGATVLSRRFQWLAATAEPIELFVPALPLAAALFLNDAPLAAATATADFAAPLAAMLRRANVLEIRLAAPWPAGVFFPGAELRIG